MCSVRLARVWRVDSVIGPFRRVRGFGEGLLRRGWSDLKAGGGVAMDPITRRVKRLLSMLG
jgi:hypothetical protein